MVTWLILITTSLNVIFTVKALKYTYTNFDQSLNYTPMALPGRKYNSSFPCVTFPDLIAFHYSDLLSNAQNYINVTPENFCYSILSYNITREDFFDIINKNLNAFKNYRKLISMFILYYKSSKPMDEGCSGYLRHIVCYHEFPACIDNGDSTFVFKKFVEPGRVVLINYGPLAGKLAVIVDILNTSKVLIHGPHTGVRRQETSIQRLSLTDFKLDITRGIHKDNLMKAIESFGLAEKWAATGWARKLEKREKRRNNTDFDRFKNLDNSQKQKSMKEIWDFQQCASASASAGAGATSSMKAKQMMANRIKQQEEEIECLKRNVIYHSGKHIEMIQMIESLSDDAEKLKEKIKERSMNFNVSGSDIASSVDYGMENVKSPNKNENAGLVQENSQLKRDITKLTLELQDKKLELNETQTEKFILFNELNELIMSMRKCKESIEKINLAMYYNILKSTEDEFGDMFNKKI